MGVRETVTRTLACDRCPRIHPFLDSDPYHEELPPGWQWWVRTGPEGPHVITQRLLCPDCSQLLALFLQGRNSPEGAAFNGGEFQRTNAARQAHGDAIQKEEEAPWN